MKTLIIALLLALLPSCLTPAQFEAGMFTIQSAQNAQLAAIEKANQDYRAGNITWEQRLAEIKQANEQVGRVMIDTVDGFKDDIEENIKTAAAVPVEVAQGLSGEAIAAIVGSVIIGGLGTYAKAKKDAVVAVNTERDLRRARLGEKLE